MLRHLVAGRTYAEIARALFISEKTVSVHVSNLLRKTGTSSRIEVADLARRVGPGQAGRRLRNARHRGVACRAPPPSRDSRDLRVVSTSANHGCSSTGQGDPAQGTESEPG